MINAREFFVNLATSQLVLVVIVCVASSAPALARSLVADNAPDVSVSAVIPSPNQDFGDEYAQGADLQRTSAASATSRAAAAPRVSRDEPQEASNEASVPIYVSPFSHAERGTTTLASVAPLPPSSFEDNQESSHAPPNYAPRPSSATAASSSTTASDLKTSASYGHHHHGGDHHGGGGHYGYGPSGWLDMGAWTGGKGSFGWYADYPVGGGKHHGYGRK